MNPASTSFVLGYHGCDRALADKVLAGRASLTASHNDYDWLGDGIYFWEYNAQRAYEFAKEVSRLPRNKRQRINRPSVVGAVIDLGLCLNLLDSRFINMARLAHLELVRSFESAGVSLPTNSGGDDLLNRELDCAVIRMLHQRRQESDEPPFETVRAAFIEGGPLYPNAGFAAKNHIQICVRDIRCIKGYFRPLDDAGKPMRFNGPPPPTPLAASRSPTAHWSARRVRPPTPPAASRSTSSSTSAPPPSKSAPTPTPPQALPHQDNPRPRADPPPEPRRRGVAGSPGGRAVAVNQKWRVSGFFSLGREPHHGYNLAARIHRMNTFIS